VGTRRLGLDAAFQTQTTAEPIHAFGAEAVHLPEVTR